MKNNNKNGFTLVELLAVIVILALIMGIAVVSIGGILNSARENTFKESALAVINGVRQQLVLADSLEEGRFYFKSTVLDKEIESPLGGTVQFTTGASGDPLVINVAREGLDARNVQVEQIGGVGVYKAKTIPQTRCGEESVSFVTVTRDGDNYRFSICLTAGEGQSIIYGSEEELLDDDNRSMIRQATSLISNPGVPTISGGATKAYNYQATTLTCATTTTYSSGTSIYYEFGYATSAANFTAGTITWLGSPSTTATYSITKNSYKGTRLFTCRIYATSDEDTTDVIPATTYTTMKLINLTLTFDATSNGGTLSGTSPRYIPYGTANVYTSASNNTAGAVPTATQSGKTFNGWFTAKTGGTKVLDAAGALQASVSGWTSASKTWVRTSNGTLYAQFS